ncbi:Hypothetical protein PHPALM_20099 [Phytophthora palmivora]|uniref:Uncharacterized protein n=1 Tax=Phytophthora palmivora TaxID=4796 RepID=A0A2P4XFP4_9STRA|nr:Hypothetical protein PHPALM_20099 [Phytophthora palmivora]
MRKNRYLCASTNFRLLMHSKKLDSALFASRSRAASLMLIRRFLKRNRLTVRRIIHKGQGCCEPLRGPGKCSCVYNMDQTTVYIDMNGLTAIEFVGTLTGDVGWYLSDHATVVIAFVLLI